MPAAHVVGEAIVVNVLVVLVGANDVADGVTALAVDFFQLGPAAPEARAVDNHLRAVVA